MQNIKKIKWANFQQYTKSWFCPTALPTFASISQIAQNAFDSSTMVGENFEIYSSQMAKNALKMCDLQTLKCKKWQKITNLLIFAKKT